MRKRQNRRASTVVITPGQYFVWITTSTAFEVQPYWTGHLGPSLWRPYTAPIEDFNVYRGMFLLHHQIIQAAKFIQINPGNVIG